MELNEKILFNNSFGSVTDKRVILNYKSGTEDLPIGQVSSISFQHKRNYFFAIFSFIMGIGGLVLVLSNLDSFGGPQVLIIITVALFALISGIANWLGHHNILISAGGQNRKPIKVEMAKTRDGRAFSEAVKKAIIK